jgi:hypothetical protein
MAVDVTAVLRELRCVRQSEEGGSEPYIWPILLWVDDTTLMNQGDEILGVRGPALSDARVVLEQSMRAGDTAAIPFPLGTLGARLEQTSQTKYVLLVVALLEQDETPETAMWAGCKAFSSELRSALVYHVPALITAVKQHDDAELQRMIDMIKERVTAATMSATWNALTAWQKTRVVLQTLNLDDYVAFAYYLGGAEPKDVELKLRSDNGSDEYRVAASVEVHTPTVDLCQPQVDVVKAAQDVVDGMEGQLAAAKATYHDASPAEKSTLLARITQLDQELDIAMLALDEARRALQACRDRWAALAETRSAVESVGPVIQP